MGKIPGFRSGKTWKKIVASIGYLFIILIVIGILRGGSNSTSQTSSPASSSAPAPVPKNKPTITKAEFDKIQNGMTYEQVTEIIGGPGEVTAESGTKGTDLYTVIYQYKGEGDLGANASMTFQGGKLEMKAQFGLK